MDTSRNELTGRCYFLDGTYAGRLVSVTEYQTDNFGLLWAICVVRAIDHDFETIFSVENINLSDRAWGNSHVQSL